MAKYRMVARCTFTDELDLSREPTESELLDVLRDVNEQFKAKGLKIQADEVMVTLITHVCADCYYRDENGYCSMVDQYTEPSDDACGSFKSMEE